MAMIPWMSPWPTRCPRGHVSPQEPPELPQTSLCSSACLTSDLGSEGAAWDVFVIEAHDDAVVARGCGQVGHGACPVLVVLAGDLCLGGTFDC